jgi:hypothetical protein
MNCLFQEELIERKVKPYETGKTLRPGRFSGKSNGQQESFTVKSKTGMSGLENIER